MIQKTAFAESHPTAEKRLYRVVAARIQDLIRAENIKPGTRLPAERELSVKLNVSRASLREALIALELYGIVEVRGGSGVYVSELAPADAAERGPGPFEVLAARRLIESEVAAIAAKMANDSAIDAILRAAAQMEQQHAGNEQADRNFHLAIARATGNTALVGVVEMLWNQRSSIRQELKEHSRTEDLRQITLNDHRNIVAAIAARDAAGARQAMRAHLERVSKTLSRG
jgi:DNA-binding FadR family transcriptional regulator